MVLHNTIFIHGLHFHNTGHGWVILEFDDVSAFKTLSKALAWVLTSKKG